MRAMMNILRRNMLLKISKKQLQDICLIDIIFLEYG